MQDPVAERKKRDNLLIAIWDGIFAAINTGCGDTYISPFAVALHATNIQIGLLTSLPNLMASLIQLKTARFIELFRSRKKLINIFVFLQALMWFPILSIPFGGLGVKQVPFLIVFCTLYVSFGSFSTPAWGSIMSDSVSEEERGKYFGLRGKVVGAVTVLSGFVAGFALHVNSANIFVGYALIFACAAIARFISNFFISKLYDPPPRSDSREHYFSFTDFVRRLPQSNFAKYVFFIGFFHSAAFMAGPYFAPLMLRDFGFSYLTYTILVTVASIASLLGLTYWGKHADEFGNVRLIKLSAILISFFPILWVICHRIWYLVLVQLAAGYLWGGFNLCIANFIYDAAIPEKRVYCISYFNVVNGIGIFLGALVGGLLSIYLPFLFGYRIFSLFVVSTLLRLFIAWFLIPQVKEVRKVKEINQRDLFLSISGLNPQFGLSDSSSFLTMHKDKNTD